MGGRSPHKPWPNDPLINPKPATPPETSQVTEGRRCDKLLLDPSGKELLRVRDRPWLGYESRRGRP